jgi:hypothetical protein
MSVCRRLLFACLIPLVGTISTTPAGASSPTNPVPAGWPKTLIIPRMHLVAPVESLDLTKSSEQMAPFKWGDVAWYNRGPRPGDVGRATMFGHLDSYCCPAAFYLLKDLRAGDTIKVAYRNGKTLTFRVMWQASYPNQKVPLNFMFGRVRERGLNLMTCGGIFHPGAGGYDHKLLVYARLVLPSGQLG